MSDKDQTQKIVKEAKGLMAHEQAKQLVDDGKALMEKDLRGGLAKLRQALAIDPDYPELEDEIFLREDAVEKLDNLLDYVVVLLKEHKEFQACQMLKELPDNYIIEDRFQLLEDLAVRIKRTEELLQKIKSLPKSEGDRALPLYEEASNLVHDYPGLQEELVAARNSFNRYKVFLDSIDESINTLNFVKTDELLRSFSEDYPDDLNIGKFEVALRNKKKEVRIKRNLKKTLVAAGGLAGLLLLLALGYFGYETMLIGNAAGEWEKVGRLLEEKKFAEAQVDSREIVAELGKVHLFFLERKADLLTKANRILSSETVQQGAAGRVMAEGVYIPVDDLARVKSAKGLIAEAARLSANGENRQAIAKYEEALPLVGGLEAKLAERFTGEITAAILNDRKEIVKGLVNEALELSRAKNFEAALARIDEASGLVGKHELQELDLVERIDKAYRQVKQANFLALVTQGDQQLAAGHENESLVAYDRALGFAQVNKLEAGNATTLARIRNSINSARVKAMLEKGDDSFRHSRWREAIANYTTAIELHQESKQKQELPAYSMALANLATARRAAALEDVRKVEVEADKYFAAGEWEKAKGAYAKILPLVDQSGYPRDPDFVAVRSAAETRLGEVDERLLIGAKRDYLMEHHRAILRKVFSLNGEVAFLNPEVVFLTEDQNGMKYSLTARSYERKGGEGKYTIYEVIYAFNRKSGDWVLLNQNMNSQVSRER